ncbi:ARM repeat-containing protein [Choiromyces venosus 120613-1]|uniref:ARM repeat-containing protein n=1 Tax=Choiromyces venosus 120613-1 TaxID=1336337 RepID=A0A3N4JEB7_9PEZI|nr:ARM repeat-containing protein [Choiromyces venosus 120613-1]
MDVVLGLSKALGTQFGEIWKLVGTLLIKYASSSEAVERSTSVGVIADCIKYMEEGCTPYTSQIMKVLLHRLSDEDQETKSNAAYAIGMLCIKSQAVQEVTGNYRAILPKLEPFLQEQNHRMLDNACGCIARMIMAHPDNVPLGDVLPALAGLLPLKEDYEENEPIYKMLVQLYKNSNQTAFGMTQQFVPIIASVLSPPEEQLTTETREELIELVQFLFKTEPGVLQGYDNLISLAN